MSERDRRAALLEAIEVMKKHKLDKEWNGSQAIQELRKMATSETNGIPK